MDESISTDDQESIDALVEWLSHSHEYGQPPDSVRVIDKRFLAWPPEWKPKCFRLLRFSFRDDCGYEDIGIGVVGSATFSFSHPSDLSRPPEDLYALYCFWEMEQRRLVRIEEDPPPFRGRQFLAGWRGPSIREVALRFVAHLAPGVGFEAREVSVASATSNGASGWAVLDSASYWYPRECMPDESDAYEVLRVHVGRSLLALQTGPTRPAAGIREPDFNQMSKAVRDFQALLQRAGDSGLSGEQRRTLVDPACGKLSGRLEDYARALWALGRSSELTATLDVLSRWMGSDLTGLHRLGKAAWICRIYGRSATYLAKCFVGEYRSASDCASMLAESLFHGGQSEVAQDTLLKAMTEVKALSSRASGRSRDGYEANYQGHRRTFLKLFPALGERRLAELDLPSTILRIED